MLNQLSLRSSLISVFLLLSILPLALVAKLAGNFYTESMQQQSLNQLASVRNIKEAQLSNYFNNLKQQTLFYLGVVEKGQMSSFNTAVHFAKQEFEVGLSSLGNTPEQRLKELKKLYKLGSGSAIYESKALRGLYDDAHNDLHPGFKALIEKFSYEDVFIIRENGDVLYSVKKEAHFASNVLKSGSELKGLRQAFLKAKDGAQSIGDEETTKVFFTDFSVDPIINKNTAYLSLPFFDYGAFIGAVVFQVNQNQINTIMSERTGLGESGETYLVGPDFKLRSGTFRSKQTAQSINQKQNIINSSAVTNALNGQSFEGITYSYLEDEVLNASMPIPVFGENWAIVAEITTQEAFSGIKKLNQLILVIGLASAIVIFLIALTLSNRIARPLAVLTRHSEEMAAGDLSKDIVVSGKNEIGRLSQSFSLMRDSIRNKIEEIQLQNTELKRLDQMKDNLLANTSHELRTPLNGIIGLSESLLEHIPDRQQRTLNHIIENGRRLSNLVNDILDAASLRNKGVNIEAQSLNLRRIVDLDLSVTAHLVGEKSLKLKNSIDEQLCVKADQNRVQQIFQNLIGNAIKFTPAGTIEVFAIDKGQMIEIHVKDSGEGIAEENKERIFTAFEQVDGSSTRSAGGTGLGLSITKHLVELHGGNIRVESTPGIGSDFIFTLPKSMEPEAEPRQQLSKLFNLDGPQSLGKVKPIFVEKSDVSHEQLINHPSSNGKCDAFSIMVVDDEPVNLEIVINHFAQSPCHLITCTSGQEALELVAKRKPDLILLDIMMPKLNGYDTCKKLRENYSVYELPIIFLTARNQLGDLIEAFNAGGCDYLSKPFFKEELLARVQLQMELSVQKYRMSSLRQFANRISEYKSQEDLAIATYELMHPDPFIEHSAILFEGEITKSSDESFSFDANLVEKDKAESLYKQDGMTTMFAQLSEYYAIAARFQSASSEEWIRNLVIQADKSMDQIRRISSDPKLSIIQTEIRERIEKIHHIKVEDKYSLIYVEQEERLKEEVHRLQLKQVMMHVNKNELYQIHRGIAVNPSKVIRFIPNSNEILLEKEVRLTVAKRYIKDLRKDMPHLF